MAKEKLLAGFLDLDKKKPVVYVLSSVESKSPLHSFQLGNGKVVPGYAFMALEDSADKKIKKGEFTYLDLEGNRIEPIAFR